ncbi:MAG TPA: FixH family protein [Saprospiraceae bacterium]|nr:FixH family protein [Saprospiraceae bacterium]
MNWGTGIVIFFSLFAVSMIAAVVATTKHPPQMVQKDYYNLDLNYQAHLEKKQHTSALPVPPSARYEANAQTVVFQLPEGMIAQSGTVKCYRSATTHDDVVLKLEQTGSIAVPAQDFAAGRWHLEADWVAADGTPYFWESTFLIPGR